MRKWSAGSSMGRSWSCNRKKITAGLSRRPAKDSQPAADALLRVVDAGLCGVIFIAPYFFGGRHDLGRLLLVSIIVVTATAWFLRQAMLPLARWPRTIAYGLLLLAAALV